MNWIPPFSYPVTFLTIFLNIYGTITSVKANVKNPLSAVR